MKLILIPDNPVCRLGVANRPKIAISIPGDDHTIHDILEKLVTPALVAMSFHPQTIFDGYRSAEVMGAREAEETAAIPDDLTEWSTPPGAPTPPEGFTFVGHNLDMGEHLEFPLEDLRFSNSGVTWHSTRLVNGHWAWYAARNGSETLAKLQAHVAAL